MYKVVKNKKVIAEKIPDYNTACTIAKASGPSWVLAPSGGIAKEYTEYDIEVFLLGQTVLSGINLECGRLYLYDLSEVRHKTCYQVYSDYTNLEHNKLYDDLDQAIHTFLQLKSKIKR